MRWEIPRIWPVSRALFPISARARHSSWRGLSKGALSCLADHTMLVLRPGQNPLVAGKVRHYADWEFAGLFDSLT